MLGKLIFQVLVICYVVNLRITRIIILLKKGQNLASIWDGLTEKHNVQVIRVLKMLGLSVYLLIYQFTEQEPKKGREKQLCKHQGARHLFLYYFHTSFLMSLFFVCFGQN